VTALPPPGWFPDPQTGGRTWRWWDGAQWAPPGYGHAGYDPATHARALAGSAASAAKTSVWLRWLMVANAVGVFAYASLAAAAGHPSSIGSNGAVVAIVVFAVYFSVSSWAFTGVLIAWLYHAGKYADLQPWPTIRSRTLGAFSILIPIVQLWWPYETIRDLFPPEAPPTTALRWWLSHLLIPIFVVIPVFVVSLILPTVAIPVVLIVVGGLLSISVRWGWQLISDLDSVQRSYLPAI
jgi:hypothetical protein